ncbi:helix-hairpin-helix domain-containing protein [Lederbergia sp. NSJ-179]|uniref:helix-hairpin-helix domain-containing protein n=1 Tax=Lederbergia sp. NSJ-179 TaxID=2931402 RepID=UPI001FD140D7|nr:helix-hairpin-helix domain-containing protein [Lederbergia sp. NSJ-179]MCJ7841812.1 helix-hairpin-helix domain-containing protein [Lederbergia sp. NSJ-179]
MLIWLEKYKHIIIGIVIGMILLFLFLFKYFQKDDAAVTDPVWTEPVTSQMEEENQDNGTDSASIFIDLKGAVKKPGLYEAVEGERIYDILERAGGISTSADENQINYAMKVHDEMVIYIPEIGEIEQDLTSLDNMNSKDDQKVNINKADTNELETLPGIGPSKAAAIIEYREENGPFKTIEELMNISGIGEKTFEKLKEQIKIQ